MKNVTQQVQKIKEFQLAIKKTKSKYLRKDYGKAIKRLTYELKEYCNFKKYDFDEIIRTARIC